MKKLLILAGVAALIAAGCSKESEQAARADANRDAAAIERDLRAARNQLARDAEAAREKARQEANAAAKRVEEATRN